jgi:uncharacterized membrane protein YraQ (UPF0718 family)
MIDTARSRRLIEIPLSLILITALLFLLPRLLTGSAFSVINDRISTFATVFLGIFIEAAPFLFLGTLASGLVEIYLDRDTAVRLMPKHVLLSAFAGSFLGLFFPVCECGIVPLVRRLFRKGFPIPAGIAFLLSAPILNPIVMVSTATAFGIGRVLLLRIGISVFIAIITGLVFSVAKTPWEILRPTAWITAQEVEPSTVEHKKTIWEEIRRVFLISSDEFFEIGRFLVIGSFVAAGMQTFIPQATLLSIGNGPLTSILVMVAMAVILSICSTVDAFVALSFASTFSLGSILAFLTFGPMVDIKSIFLYLRVFRKRTVLYLVLLPLIMSVLAGLIINFYLAG